MRKQAVILSIALSCAVILGNAAPAAALGAAPSDFRPALMDEVNREHEAVKKPLVSFDEYIKEASSDDFDLSPYKADMTTDYGKDFNGDTPLSMEQAREDVDILFRTLQTTYGAYYYFGGDKRFGEAREAVLKGCGEAEKAGELTCGALADLLLKELSFIQDGHFRIAGKTLDSPYIPYFYKTAAYEKTDGSFEEIATGRFVSSVDGWEDLNQLFKRSLSPDGEVVYYPVVLEKFKEDWDYKPADLTVHYTDGSAQTLQADAYESYYDKDAGKKIELHENQGVPVLFVRNMGFDEAEGDTLGREFLSYAEELKEEPAVILDLRSNGGGNGILPFKWMQEYAGVPVTTNYVSVKYWSETDMRLYAENKENPFYSSWESMVDIAGYEPISENYVKANAQPDMFADNDRLLVILTGKNTGSAAEMFVDMAHNVRNTLIIGENTYGVLVSNAYTVVALPNSHTPVQLGSDLSIFPDGDSYFKEFMGFQPDIWTAGPDAEELAVKLVKRLQNGAD